MSETGEMTKSALVSSPRYLDTGMGDRELALDRPLGHVLRPPDLMGLLLPEFLEAPVERQHAAIGVPRVLERLLHTE